MVYVRCPRCEINYIEDYQRLCKVCEDEINGNFIYDDYDEELYCSACGKRIAMDGSELCSVCSMNYIQ